MAADDRRQSRLAGDTPFQKATAKYQFRFDGLRGHDHRRELRRAGEHDHQRLRRRLGVPARRLQPGGQRHVVRPRRLDARGACPGGADGRRVDLREVQRQPVARLLLSTRSTRCT